MKIKHKFIKKSGSPILVPTSMQPSPGHAQVVVGRELIGEIPRTGDHRTDAMAATALMRAKGHKSPTKVQQMFAVAAAFSTTARDVQAKHLTQEPMNTHAGVAFIVNAVFSIELYLKTIQASVSRPAKTHGLLDLYNALPTELKAEIAGMAETHAETYKVERPVDFGKLLAPLSKAFERWRYVYEHAELATLDFASLVLVMRTLHEVGRLRAKL